MLEIWDTDLTVNAGVKGAVTGILRALQLYKSVVWINSTLKMDFIDMHKMAYNRSIVLAEM